MYLTFISLLEGAKIYSQTGWRGMAEFSIWIRHWGSTSLWGLPVLTTLCYCSTICLLINIFELSYMHLQGRCEPNFVGAI